MKQEPKQVRIIGIIGRPGSGKSAIAMHLQKDLQNSAVVSFGQVTRDSTDANHRFHNALRVARDVAFAGGMPTAEDLQPVVEVTFRDLIESGIETIISDGFPRRGDQIPLLLNLFSQLTDEGMNIRDQYLYLFAPQDQTQERIGMRKLFYGQMARADDDSDKEDIRRAIYETITWDAARQIAERGRLTLVDARKPIDQVYRQVSRELSLELPRPLDEVFQEIRGWADKEENIPSSNYEGRMERR